MKTTFTLAWVLLLIACQQPAGKIDKSAVSKEVADTEAAFAKMAADQGVAEAFYHYAADGAVIKRENDSLITGRDNIKAYYSQEGYAQAMVSWAPDFIEVSDDGNMAYAYGKYLWQIPSEDTTAAANSFSGVYMTVWKRQADNSWRYVWD